MSSDVPSAGAGGTEPSRVDYLGDAEPTKKKSRWPLAAGGAVVAVALVGAAAYGVTQFLSDGTTPAQAVPASAIGYLSIDIDPGKDQQLAAYRTMKKFPALESELNLDEGGDLRTSLFEAIKEESGCEDLDFEADVEPWLGKSAAFAALPGEGEDDPMPFAVLEVTDGAAAEEGVTKLAECGGGDVEDGGAFRASGDFLVVAETDEDIDRVLSEAEEGTLADDDTFQARVDEAGGAGFVTGYAAPDAALVFLDEVSQETESLAGTAPSEEEKQLLEETFEDFEGAAMSLRFEDEGVTLKLAGAGIVQDDLAEALSGGDAGMDELPESTIAAYGVPVGDELVARMLDFFEKVDTEGELQQGVEEFEATTGLSVPEDLQTLLGDGFSIALDSSVDLEGLNSGATAPEEIPFGVRIKGDPGEIREVLERALEASGAPPNAVVIEEGEDALAVGLSQDYVSELAGTGDLAGNAAYESVFGDLEGDEASFFLSFESDWLVDLVGSFPGEDTEKIRDNLEPLQGMGAATRVDEDGFVSTLRITTD